ncbi:hypothetical protein SRHO_G00131270 [Serrasalmus rhombeus]
MPKLSLQFRSSPVWAVLSDFKEFYTSAQASQKDMENAELPKSHATRFVLHMYGLSKSSRLDNFSFLFNYGHIRSWPVSLLKQGYAVTSVKNMLFNSSAFMSHLCVFHSEMSGLTVSQFDQILMQIKRLQKDNARRIKAHQKSALHAQSAEAYSQALETAHLTFLQAAAWISLWLSRHSFGPPGSAGEER